MNRVRIAVIATAMALSGAVCAQTPPAAAPPSPPDFSEVKIKTTGKANGTDIPPQEVTIDLTKPYDPTKATGNLPPGAEVKVAQAAPLGEPLVVVLRGTRLALRKDEAAWIIVA